MAPDMESLTTRSDRIAACVLVLMLAVACVAIGAMAATTWRIPASPPQTVIPTRMA